MSKLSKDKQNRKTKRGLGLGKTNTLTENEGKTAKEAIEDDLEDGLPNGYTARVVVALGQSLRGRPQAGNYSSH